jgi:hypothetical protein
MMCARSRDDGACRPTLAPAWAETICFVLARMEQAGVVKRVAVGVYERGEEES